MDQIKRLMALREIVDEAATELGLPMQLVLLGDRLTEEILCQADREDPLHGNLRTCERWDCEAQFLPTQPDQKYHSPYCSQLAARRRHQAKVRNRRASEATLLVGQFNRNEISIRELVYQIKQIGDF